MYLKRLPKSFDHIYAWHGASEQAPLHLLNQAFRGHLAGMRPVCCSASCCHCTASRHGGTTTNSLLRGSCCFVNTMAICNGLACFQFCFVSRKSSQGIVLAGRARLLLGKLITHSLDSARCKNELEVEQSQAWFHLIVQLSRQLQ